MAFTSGHDLWAYRQSFSTRSLLNLKATGTTYVHLTVILEQRRLYTNSPRHVSVKTDIASMRHIIRKVHRLGFSIFLKPIVFLPDGTWRGYLPGGRKWFDAIYIPWLLRVAAVAQAEPGVAIFSVGSELRGTLRQRGNWVRTIRAVKKVYTKGWVTYVANHDAYQRATFWDEVDFVSISAYFKLLATWNTTLTKRPSMVDTIRMWRRQAAKVNRWRQAAGLSGKKVLLAEAGAQSKGGGVVYVRPWAFHVDGPVDLLVQRVVYEAIFRAFMKKKWSLGVILYEWDARPDAGKRAPTDRLFTPQNKPAQKVMKRWFAKMC